MAEAIKAPTSTIGSSGTWDSTDYTVVNDFPDTADYLVHGTTAGYIEFGFSAFSLPSDASNIVVYVDFYTRDATSGNNRIGGRIYVNGTAYNFAYHNPGTTFTLYEDSWTVNPETSAAWTYTQVNTLLTRFGIHSSTDANPALWLSSIQLRVTYDVPQVETGGAMMTLAPKMLSWPGSGGGGATALWSDGYESGSFSGWSGNGVTGTVTNEVIAGALDTGSYGHHIAFAGASSGSGWAFRTQSWPASNLLYAKIRAKFNTAGTGGTVECFGFREESTAYRMIACLRRASGTWQLFIYTRAGSEVTVALSSSPTLGVWYTWKLLCDKTGANPVFTLWMDGTQVATYTDSSAGTRTVHQFRACLYEYAWTAAGDAYYDNAAVYDAEPDGSAAGINHAGTGAGKSTLTPRILETGVKAIAGATGAGISTSIATVKALGPKGAEARAISASAHTMRELSVKDAPARAISSGSAVPKSVSAKGGTGKGISTSSPKSLAAGSKIQTSTGAAISASHVASKGASVKASPGAGKSASSTTKRARGAKKINPVLVATRNDPNVDLTWS